MAVNNPPVVRVKRPSSNRAVRGSASVVRVPQLDVQLGAAAAARVCFLLVNLAAVSADALLTLAERPPAGAEPHRTGPWQDLRLLGVKKKQSQIYSLASTASVWVLAFGCTRVSARCE